MSKSALLKTVTLFLGILLCLASIPATFAQEEYPEESDTEIANVSSSNEIIHEITPSYYDLYLQQGESSSFTVSFKNNDNKALEIEPYVTVSYSDYGFNESWITISPANAMVDPGAEQEFTVDVNIPEDANGGYSQARIAFTDDSYSEEYGYYTNAMDLYITIPICQKLELQTSYISDSVEAGEEYEYTVKIKNVASKSITLDPEISEYIYGCYSSELDLGDEIEITAPSTLEPDQVADMVIRVPVPENATGTYDGYIGMNVDGSENNGYEPQLELYLTVLQQPSDPYVKTFSTKNADPITIEVSTSEYGMDSWLRSPPKDESPSFELSLKYNSSPVDMSLVKTTQTGNVGIGWNYFPTWSEEDGITYENYDRQYTQTYTVPGAIGDWKLEILPKNVESFEYSITIGESD
jgi:hypothetical protein